MQCTSYVPVYYRARDLNVGGSDFSWLPFDSNNCGEERGYNVSTPLSNMDQFLGYDKDVLKQIIQDHEATFRYQVQELHRLYRRQREIMGERRVREIFGRHLLSQTSESVHSSSHTRPELFQTPSHATIGLFGDLSRNVRRPSNFIAGTGYNENRILDLVLPGDLYCDGQGKQFRERNLSDIGSAKTVDSSGLNLYKRKMNCFIDLNEPVEPESVPSRCTSHMEIDLNSMPTEIALENFQYLNNESCVYGREMKNKDREFLKTEIDIDLNTGELEDHSPPLSSTVIEIKLEEDTELVGPVSPENEECSPPRGKSEDIQVETPLIEEGEPCVELDTIAAQTLVTISSSRFQEHDFNNTLHWFAEIASSTAEVASSTAGTSRGNERARVRKQYKGFQIEGPFKRKMGRKGCAKPRKYSKLSPTDVVKKSISSILKQPATRSRQGVLQSWAETRKRQGGRRGRASKFLVSL